jgi:hypothetical protein
MNLTGLYQLLAYAPVCFPYGVVDTNVLYPFLAMLSVRMAGKWTNDPYLKLMNASACLWLSTAVFTSMNVIGVYSVIINAHSAMLWYSALFTCVYELTDFMVLTLDSETAVKWSNKLIGPIVHATLSQYPSTPAQSMQLYSHVIELMTGDIDAHTFATRLQHIFTPQRADDVSDELTSFVHMLNEDTIPQTNGIHIDTFIETLTASLATSNRNRSRVFMDESFPLESDVGIECPICREPCETHRTLHCNHQFHPDCIDAWVAQGNLTCPMCRRDIMDVD